MFRAELKKCTIAVAIVMSIKRLIDMKIIRRNAHPLAVDRLDGNITVLYVVPLLAQSENRHMPFIC